MKKLDRKFVNKVVQIAKEAGLIVMQIYNKPFTFQRKRDSSPVTKADLLSEKFISSSLQKLTTKIPVIAEESFSIKKNSRQLKKTFWLVDPLDGTKEFISKNGQFTINIGLIKNGKPIFGVIHAPAKRSTFFGLVKEKSAYQNSGRSFKKMTVRKKIKSGPMFALSRSHGKGKKLKSFLSKVKSYKKIEMGSSLKFCLVASGRADIYPRFSPTMEWDTAAGQAILEAAGGQVTDIKGKNISYGKKGYKNPYFIASSGTRK